MSDRYQQIIEQVQFHDPLTVSEAMRYYAWHAVQMLEEKEDFELEAATWHGIELALIFLINASASLTMQPAINVWNTIDTLGCKLDYHSLADQYSRSVDTLDVEAVSRAIGIIMHLAREVDAQLCQIGAFELVQPQHFG